jgi:hypothetical protein
MCDSVVLFITPRGKDLWLQCGRTGMYGERVICESCRRSPDAMRAHDDAEENIREDNAWAASANWGEF